MKKILASISFILFICSQSKASDLIIELAPTSATVGVNFSCLKVIDARDNKDNLGFVTRGLKNNDSKVIFPSKFKEYLELTINKLLPKNPDNPKLVILFRNLVVSENIGTMNQYGYCNLEVEFARQTDSLLYSLGTFQANIIENNNTIKYSHGKRILQALEECFTKFDKSDWKTNNGILIQNIDSNIIFDYKTVPPKGVYLNYSQMIRKAPLDSINFEIKQVKETNKFISYEIDFKSDINTELVQFISDGNSVYIHSNSKQYLKSREFGKYIYFQGKFPVSSNPDQVIFLVGVGAVGGLAGGLLFSLALDAASNSNATVKGIVLNTEKGIIKPLTDYYLVEIAREFPELLKEYRNSKRDLADKENLIIKLNSKF